MRPIGFSTGALAYADFRLGLRMLSNKPVQAIELSALRQNELIPLLQALPSLDLAAFQYISIHVPSQLENGWEVFLVECLLRERTRRWPFVLHPDVITDYGLWRELGNAICIENMDNRKQLGRNARELDKIFKELPDALFCFDIGHARQYDPTMTEAWVIVREFRTRLRQIHVSEVNTSSKHDVLSFTSIGAFQEIAEYIPNDIPLILETPVSEKDINAEIAKAFLALPNSKLLAA